MKSYPSTDLIAFGACPPIASKIFGFPIGNLGRTRGDVKRDAEDSLPRLLRLFVVPPTKIVETQMPDVESYSSYFPFFFACMIKYTQCDK